MTRALINASHPGPGVAVTILAALLAASAGATPATTAFVAAAVLAGQLTVGWTNDLVDAARDRQVGRTDKPVAGGAVSEVVVRRATAVGVVACVVLSLACGWLAGLIHLACVASAWAYNLGLKSTVLSWLPYALSFGGLTVFVSLAVDPDTAPPLWLPVAGALLGVGAHLVNVLPDLADDAATGIRGLPHRIGPRWTPVLAVAVLVLASVTIAVGADRLTSPLGVAGLVVVAALAMTALVVPGRAPFRAAIGIALTDVLLLVTAR